MTQNFQDMGSRDLMTGWIDTHAVTRITSKMHRIRWTIENVSRVVSDTNLIGPDFWLTPTWKATIVFKQSAGELFVYVWNNSDTDIQTERKLSLLDCNGKTLHEDKDSKVFTLEKDKYVDMVGSVENRSRFETLPNNTLVVDLTLDMKGEITTELHHFKYDIDHRTRLIKDLKTMQENSVSADVTLQIDNETIPGHWSVLCSRSPYFKKMFDSEMQERLRNSIIITDISFATLKKLIGFLYTADFDDGDDFDGLFDLYYAADKYEVPDLRSLCGCRIMSKATADNVCRVLQIAQRHNDEGLKMQAIDYIRFHSDDVFQTEGWKKFQSSEPLAAELFSFCLKKNK